MREIEVSYSRKFLSLEERFLIEAQEVGPESGLQPPDAKRLAMIRTSVTRKLHRSRTRTQPDDLYYLTDASFDLGGTCEAQNLCFTSLPDKIKRHYFPKEQQHAIIKDDRTMPNLCLERVSAKYLSETKSNIQGRVWLSTNSTPSRHTAAPSPTRDHFLDPAEVEDGDAIAKISLCTHAAPVTVARASVARRSRGPSDRSFVKPKRSFRRSFTLKPLPLSAPILLS